MEGVGSRAGRASSRYGPTSTTFTGPVRKWKKQWVHVSSPHKSNNTASTNNNNNSAATSPIRLRRWTPVTPTQATGSGDSSAKLEEPPRRKFRYTPIVDLEEQKKEDTEKVDGYPKPEKAGPLTVESISQSEHTNGASMAAFKDPLNLELDLNGCDEDSESEAEVEVSGLVKVSSAGSWP